MRKFLLFASFAVCVFNARAGATASVVCGDNQVPSIVVNFTSDTDSGMPGLVFLGVLSSDRTAGVVMSDNTWATYQSGLYPYWLRFDNALPMKLSRSLPIPGGGSNTAAIAGFGLYVGHGALDAAGQQKLNERRTVLVKAKPALAAAGAWNAEYESDERYMWALVQQDMITKGKNALIMTIPYIDCTNNYGSG